MEYPSIIVLTTLLSLLQTLHFFWPFKQYAVHFFGTLSQKRAYFPDSNVKETVKAIKATADRHEVASLLTALIHEDGAGSWPPRANHRHSSWPDALRPYKEIYLELAPLLPQHTPSLNHEINLARIANFRSRYRKLLCERVDLPKVKKLLEAAESGRWDVFPRDIYNALYCCIGTSRHAYRWATIPVVSAAQVEQRVDIPAELDEPWAYLQRHFACPSESGNNMSNLVLNFDDQLGGQHILKINTGMPDVITSAEEQFARIFYEVEQLALPVYYDIVLAIITFSRGDKAACACHVSSISTQLRHILNSYYERVHDTVIPLSVWLSHVQGFYAWGAGHQDDASGEWNKFDGLSGNQVLFFQVLDAFLGIEQYLSPRDQERNVPIRQRVFCKAVEKHSFRRQLDSSEDESDAPILREIDEIIKRLRASAIKYPPSANHKLILAFAAVPIGP